jgi:pentose-5-phosphate-3-epimerase
MQMADPSCPKPRIARSILAGGADWNHFDVTNHHCVPG